MRLYLSSYEWGDRTEQLFALLGDKPKRAAVITNAVDQFPESGIVERFAQDQAYLQAHGISADRIDLRMYFDKHGSGLRNELSQYGLVWVKGGNSFVLRRAMAQSGFDGVITDLLHNDAIVYGGFSAGGCVMGATLHGIELVDDPHVVPEGYDPDVIWDGLNVVPFAIAPHYKSDHPESPAIDNVVAYFEKHDIPYKPLRDGEAIVIT